MDISVTRYVQQLEAERVGQQSQQNQPNFSFPEEGIVAEIHSVLCSFVTTNPEAWAPIISKWSLELLGDLSSNYAGKGLGMAGGLSESLQLWMSCRATRTLMDITTQCLACLMNSDTESCINSLLDVSVAHSPHFDWVVAHVGSCFPKTVVTRVLSCGLKDFYAQGLECNAQRGRGFIPGHFDPQASKLNSVVGILAHLAGSHFGDIRTALLDLFKWSLSDEDSTDALKLATVPYLLHLASLNSILFKALSAEALQSLNCKMLPKLAKLASSWSNYFGGGTAMQDLVVHLALGCEQGGAQAFSLLLDAAGPEGGLTMEQRYSCAETLELFLQEVSLMVRTVEVGQPPIQLAMCIRKELHTLQPLLLSSDGLRAHATLRLISLMGHHSSAVPLLAIAFLLSNATQDYQLGAILALCEATKATQPNLLADALEQELGCRDNKNHKTLWCNLASLLKYEHETKTGPVLEAAKRCFPSIAEAVRDGNSEAAKVLELALPAPQGVEISLKLTRATTTYFFHSLEETDDLTRIAAGRRAVRLLTKLCRGSLAARALALRELLEGAIRTSQARLFGAMTTRRAKPGSMLTSSEPTLLKDNQKQSVSVLLPQRKSTVFHAGIIGIGPRRMITYPVPPAAQVFSNCQLLIEACKACCCQDGDLDKPPNPEAMNDLALIMVELISPDVMYNDLQWPDEEFSKEVTVERDQHIRRIMDDKPVVWDLLRLVATQRPALCYCSVLLRAYAASLMGQWRCIPGIRPPKLVSQTQQLLDVLLLGQLIPLTLATSRHMIPSINPPQILMLMRDVWNYLKDNVPSPKFFKRDPVKGEVAWREKMPEDSPYSETLRLIMQSHLETLGGLYAQVFVKPQLGEAFSKPVG
ncbi:Hypothetical predicted protein [Cloeon dipterum]|uniref:Integrator complex subunit 5 C-terminal domain-containing protein n=1 Tax=Cloeon dipterum TaxID=197152 RepID=A0A8S1CBH9_9INSE|nr:Hypothetical predicted protein [Cloeon dipterum]